MLRIPDGLSTRFFRPGCRLVHTCALLACLVGVSACQAAPLSPTQPGVMLSPQTSDPPLTEQEANRLRIDGPILLNDSASIAPETRSSAAQELLSLAKPQALAILDKALRSGSPPVISAVLLALRESESPPAPLLEALLVAANTPPDEILAPLGTVLAKYGWSAAERVSRSALDRQIPVENRLGSIHILGYFSTRESVQRLMILLSPDRAEPDPVILAACAGLEQSTGMPFGEDSEQWRAWWAEARDLPRRTWMEHQIHALMDLVTRLREDIQKEQQARRHIAEQFTSIYRDLFPALPPKEQMSRLPLMLESPFLPVREFAVDRIARILRDSRPIPEAVQLKLRDRLADPEASLRSESLRLLDELAFPDLSEQIAARLSRETEPEVARRACLILMRRPTLSALPGVLQWIEHPGVQNEAANALWAIADLIPLEPADSMDQLSIRQTLRPLWDQSRDPLILRVLTRFAPVETMAEFLPLLDGDDAALRDALAEGLVRRPLVDPLLERAGNPALYPFAVQGLVAAPATPATLKRLGELKPSEATKQVWEEGIALLAAKLPPEDIVATDDLLKSFASLELRRRVLESAWALPPATLNGPPRLALAERLVEVLLELRLPDEAHALLAPLESELLDDLRFSVALSSGQHFDEAAAFNSDPQAWISHLENLALHDPPRARLLSSEINRRFGSQMDESTRSLFQTAVDRIPPPPLPESPAPSDDDGNASG